MKVTNEIRDAIQAWKDDKNLSLRAIGSHVGISLTSVRNWLNNEHAEMRQSTYEKLHSFIEPYFNESEVSPGTIKNTPELRNLILLKILSSKTSLESLEETLKHCSSPSLQEALTEQAPPFSPKLLSELFARLDIPLEESPLNESEKSLLYVDIVTRSLHCNTAPLKSLADKHIIHSNYPIGNFEENNITAYKVSNDNLLHKGIINNDIIITREISYREVAAGMPVVIHQNSKTLETGSIPKSYTFNSISEDDAFHIMIEQYNSSNNCVEQKYFADIALIEIMQIIGITSRKY